MPIVLIGRVTDNNGGLIHFSTHCANHLPFGSVDVQAGAAAFFANVERHFYLQQNIYPSLATLAMIFMEPKAC